MAEEEEEVPPLPTRQQKRQGPAILAEDSDPAPKKLWVKRVTAAALAEQVSHLVQVIPAWRLCNSNRPG